MLLRRFSAHVREQNWTAVAIDFAVVVLGIFVGLQVDDWNNERKERVRERAHLVQLAEDFRFNQQASTSLAEHHAERASDLRFAIGMLGRGDASAEDLERARWAILRMRQYPPFPGTTGGYDSLLASGDFAILRDADLKSRLVRLDASLGAHRDWVAKLAEYRAADDWLERFTYAEPHPGGRGVLNVVDFDGLGADRSSLGLLSGAARIHQMLADQYRLYAETFAELEGLVAASLGDDKDVPS